MYQCLYLFVLVPFVNKTWTHLQDSRFLIDRQRSNVGVLRQIRWFGVVVLQSGFSDLHGQILFSLKPLVIEEEWWARLDNNSAQVCRSSLSLLFLILDACFDGRGKKMVEVPGPSPKSKFVMAKIRSTCIHVIDLHVEYSTAVVCQMPEDYPRE